MLNEMNDAKKSRMSDQDYNSKVILQMTDIISENPEDYKAYVMRGNHYLDAGKLIESISDLTKDSAMKL